MTITIVGLGPGNPEQLTLEAWRTLENATTVLLWSEDHIAIVDLPPGPAYIKLSEQHEAAGDVGDLYDRLIEAVCAYDDIVFAVPGDPFIFELTDRIMTRAAKEGKAVQIVSGMSFIEPTLAALGIVGGAGLQIHQAVLVAEMHHPPFNPDMPVLLAMVHNTAIAAQIKRILLNQYPADHQIYLVYKAGSPLQTVETLSLDKLDQSPHIGPATTVYIPPVSRVGSLSSLQETMSRLRAPDGCPWDREQTHETLRPYLLEEAYEVIDAIDAGDTAALCEELGDLLLQVVFHAQVAVENDEFRMIDVVTAINEKLHRRHPHVWGDVTVNGSADVTQNWEAIKKQERQDNGKSKKSLLDGIAQALPALSQAYSYQVRAARVGFDWDDISGVIEKIVEEIAEIQEAATPEQRTAEMGDLLFALVNWMRWLDVEPEMALRETNQRFYRRFSTIEQSADEQGIPLSEMTLQEMDALWDAAKAQGL
ncbi:nucleoside triphosphate pyrophosphohydrolase [Chloroflexota bacterium]